MRTALVLSLLLFVGLAGSGGAQPAQVGGDLPRPLPLFPAAHWWNVDVSRAPVDPASGALIVGVFTLGLRLLGADAQWTYLMIGALIIGAVAIDQWIRRVTA